MSAIDELRKQQERLTEQVQTKVSPSELEDLEFVVSYLKNEAGMANATRSSVMRTFLTTGIEAFKEELAQSDT